MDSQIHTEYFLSGEANTLKIIAGNPLDHSTCVHQFLETWPCRPMARHGVQNRADGIFTCSKFVERGRAADNTTLVSKILRMSTLHFRMLERTAKDSLASYKITWQEQHLRENRDVWHDNESRTLHHLQLFFDKSGPGSVKKKKTRLLSLPESDKRLFTVAEFHSHVDPHEKRGCPPT